MMYWKKMSKKSWAKKMMKAKWPMTISKSMNPSDPKTDVCDWMRRTNTQTWWMTPSKMM